jgi:hypothetical protein
MCWGNSWTPNSDETTGHYYVSKLQSDKKKQSLNLFTIKDEKLGPKILKTNIFF